MTVQQNEAMGRIDVCNVCALSAVAVKGSQLVARLNHLSPVPISFSSLEKFTVLFAMNCLVASSLV